MCNIAYNSLVFDEATRTVTLSGQADCSQITAELISAHITTSKTTTVGANGNWTIVYSGADLLLSTAAIKQQCGKSVKVNAHCTQDPSCHKNGDFILSCTNNSTCPQLNLSLVSLSENCNDGQTEVTFEIAFSNTVDPSVYEIDFGDGNDEVISFNPQQNPLTVTHGYSGGDYTVSVTSILPTGCPPSNTIEIEVPNCGGNCPDITLQLISASACNNGQRIVTFGISASNITGNCFCEIDFGDGNDSSLAFDSTTAFPYQVSHNYSSGNYSAVVNSIFPANCPSSNPVLLVIQPCETNCPDDISFEIIDDSGNRFKIINNNEGIFEAVTNNPLHNQIDCLEPGAYIIRAVNPTGNGFEFTWREDELQPIQSNSRDFNFSIGSGNTKSITVVVEKDNCPPLAETVVIKKCKKECCPELTGLSVTCMTNCPESNTVTLTATGNNLDCAEVYSWDFGDGTTAETTQPSTSHTYLRHDAFNTVVSMIKPENCNGPRIVRARNRVAPCPPSCFCAFLAIISSFLLLAFLSLMPIIACISDPSTSQILIIILIVVLILLAVFLLWWLLDPCCKPTPCELMRIFFWVFSWSLIILGIIAIGGTCVSVLPFVLSYTVAQQIFLGRINALNCNPGAPDIFSWPFRNCQ
ncbi:MAG: PKD domain-containing protein [Flavobacterium sp.]|nr:PKD domain-containing protein [Flavobacterium sp.]